jgi:hypothetical protein
MHIHLGLHHALITFAEVIIIGFFWRLASMYYHATKAGQAMAFLY